MPSRRSDTPTASKLPVVPAGVLADRLSTAITAVDRKASEVAFGRLIDRCRYEDEGDALVARFSDARIGPFLKAAFGDSPFLAGLAIKDPARLVAILSEAPEARMDRLVARCRDLRGLSEADLMRELRLAKQDAALTIGLADLAGAVDLEWVTGSLTRLADAALSAAIRHVLTAFAERGKLTLADPDDPERSSGYIVLSMGKGGAFELNYSSDLDLIIFFDARRARLADPDEAVDTFVRITRQVARILQETTPDGYVFRIDLRLRPDPGATPAAMSIDAAFVYYESMGQNWERAAMIKARAAAGDIEAGEAFLKELTPFIWRKSFDYAAIADVHSIKRQIHSHKGHETVAVKGHNVKLGRGGIREIEFFVQTQQLIAGGRDPGLRGRATLDMLDRLVERGWIKPDVRDELAEAYRFLRMVEHRIQMVADEQTHVLPSDQKGCERIGRMMGFERYADFADALRKRLDIVSGHYSRLFEHAPQLSGRSGNLVFTGGEDDPGTLATIAKLGYKRPQEVTAAIRSWHFGRYAAVRSTVARERLTEITPALLEALAATRNADAAFLAFDRLVARLPTGVQLFSILASNSGLLALIAEIVGTAPRLADLLTRRPRVIDALLDPAFFGDLPDEDELADRLQVSFAEARSYEDVLDRARIFGQEQIFLIGVRILTGTVSPEDAGEAYARLAGVLLRALFARVEAEFVAAHGRIPGGEAAVVAMGKLGGREMTASSDLDLMLLYDMPEDADMSDGPKPLMGAQYYARLTQRLIAALSAPTAEGKVYDVDFRLRPSGNKGPLATPLSGFVGYQISEAWTWEHMALTRARVIAGGESIAGRIEAAIAEVIETRRKPAKVIADVVEMRGLIEEEKRTDDIWDIKQVAGGLVDVEFIAQAMTLIHAADHPGIRATSTMACLKALRDAGVLAGPDADVLIPALGLYQSLTQVLRMASDGPFDPKTCPVGLQHLLARAAEMPSLKTLQAHLTETERAVRAAFRRILAKS